MCGIAGVFCSGGVGPYRTALATANQIADHRGPDGEGQAFFDLRTPGCTWLSFEAGAIADDSVATSATLALGHRRLAIIDLSAAARQPMASDDQSLWIVFNGEIYNFVELRAELEQAGHVFRSQSDTEVILHAYQAWGEACVARFIGMWAFGLVDLRARRLFCSRDRFGIKPFHYYHDGHRFVFASEIKQLLCFPFVPRRVSEKAVYEYLVFEPGDGGTETFFAGISRLPQGHNATIDLATGRMTTDRYYPGTIALTSSPTPSEAASEFQRLLSDSVRLQLRSDVAVGSCLSGGLDSSAIVCLMSRLLDREGRRDLQCTFSSHFDDREANELEYMQEIIAATGVKAAFTYPDETALLADLDRLVWHQEEPFGSTSIFAQWCVFRLIHDHGVKVVLDGQGADEILAGYASLVGYYVLELTAKHQYGRLLWETWRYARLQGVPWSSVLRRWPATWLGGRRRRLVATAALDWVRPELVTRYAGSANYLANLRITPFGPDEHLSNALYQFTFLNNLPTLLRYEDRNAMAFSVESRVPFLDHRLVEYVRGLPSVLKFRDGYTKRVMRDALAGILPDNVRWRARKLGFATPERQWQGAALRPLIVEALGDERLRRFVVPERADAYWRAAEKDGRLDFAPWRWLNLSRWLHRYDLD